MTNAELIQLIERAAHTRGLAASTFCRLAVNDGKLIGRLRDGGTVTLDTVRRIEAFATEDAA
jgi:hypothetical protein